MHEGDVLLFTTLPIQNFVGSIKVMNYDYVDVDVDVEYRQSASSCC